MTIFTKYEPGTFSWVDLMSPDAAAARSFYQELCGWGAIDNPTDQGGVYTQFTLRDLPVAGLGEMNDEMKSSGMPAIWNSYVSVQDVEATTARASELGAGVVMPPMQVMQAGRMAILADPTGAQFSLWEPGEHVGAGVVNEPVSLSWNELASADPDQASRFYQDLFGWAMEEADGGYRVILNNGRPNGGIMALGPERAGMPSYWGVYLAVDDCDASLGRAEQLGARVLVPAMDIPQGRFGTVQDPQGGVITLMKIDAPD